LLRHLGQALAGREPGGAQLGANGDTRAGVRRLAGARPAVVARHPFSPQPAGRSAAELVMKQGLTVRKLVIIIILAS
jgi:hypothetical protein